MKIEFKILVSLLLMLISSVTYYGQELELVGNKSDKIVIADTMSFERIKDFFYLQDKKKDWKGELKGFIQTDVALDFQEIAFKEGFSAITLADPKSQVTSTNFSVKQSQLGLDLKKNSAFLGALFSAYVEVDFFGSNGSMSPRFRQGYIKWGNFLVGQTWSNFSDINIFPNIFDFVGPNGLMLVRKIQFRYSQKLSQKNSLSLSLEDPNTQGLFISHNDYSWKNISAFPTFTVLYHYGNNQNYLKIGGIIAPIKHEIMHINSNKRYNPKILGYGGMLSGKMQCGRLCNVGIQGSYGKGIANNNVVLAGENYDAIFNPENKMQLERLGLLNIVGMYEGWWSEKWSSVLYYSYSKISGSKYVPDLMIQSFQNAGVNLIFHPLKNIRIGIEGNYGKVEKFGQKGSNGVRLQFSNSFSF
ncbi:DcaP family trimeric outer membrane transporter [Elizabethkingia anophelis]|uniref:Porin n=1 Tax=Elizabethkingia anophelis TaxID=1117645 RepID=A0AAU8UV69_9FLAO|nr:DcaP family trimeric outer membrane transporter [Elizabethkingia anophelis]AQX02218.1 hypothetical protein BBD32_12465 [Elizabethkingia anophelis]OPB61679.1 hypothetical protein BAY11_17470 [Elizabethkingia anophelis]